jgi:hypothetical protein
MNPLEQRIAALEAILGRGNFATASVQQKDATFNGKLKLMNRDTLPAYAEAGQLAVLNGVLYVASASNTWTAVTGGAGTIITSGLGVHSIAFSTTTYVDTSGVSTTITDLGDIVTRSGQLKNLYIAMKSNSVNGTTTFQLYKNGSSTTVTTTVGSSSTTTASDTTHSVSVVAGDIIRMIVVTGGSSGTIAFGFSYEID